MVGTRALEETRNRCGDHHKKQAGKKNLQTFLRLSLDPIFYFVSIFAEKKRNSTTSQCICLFGRGQPPFRRKMQSTCNSLLPAFMDDDHTVTTTTTTFVRRLVKEWIRLNDPTAEAQ